MDIDGPQIEEVIIKKSDASKKTRRLLPVGEEDGFLFNLR